jgi:hypothetical protein
LDSGHRHRPPLVGVPRLPCVPPRRTGAYSARPCRPPAVVSRRQPRAHARHRRTRGWRCKERLHQMRARARRPCHPCVCNCTPATRLTHGGRALLQSGI